MIIKKEKIESEVLWRIKIRKFLIKHIILRDIKKTILGAYSRVEIDTNAYLNSLVIRLLCRNVSKVILIDAMAEVHFLFKKKGYNSTFLIEREEYGRDKGKISNAILSISWNLNYGSEYRREVYENE